MNYIFVVAHICNELKKNNTYRQRTYDNQSHMDIKASHFTGNLTVSTKACLGYQQRNQLFPIHLCRTTTCNRCIRVMTSTWITFSCVDRSITLCGNSWFTSMLILMIKNKEVYKWQQDFVLVTHNDNPQESCLSLDGPQIREAETIYLMVFEVGVDAIEMIILKCIVSCILRARGLQIVFERHNTQWIIYFSPIVSFIVI